jgi:hypothetical protein
MKILLAGILGAIAMFIWTSVAHMALPLGEAGISEIPNEQAVLTVMQSTSAKSRAFTFFRASVSDQTQPGRKKTKR